MPNILDSANGIEFEVELREVLQVVEVLYLADLVVSEVNYALRTAFSMPNLDFGDLVAMQIKHFQLKQNTNVLDFADLVLRKQKHL